MLGNGSSGWAPTTVQHRHSPVSTANCLFRVDSARTNALTSPWIAKTRRCGVDNVPLARFDRHMPLVGEPKLPTSSVYVPFFVRDLVWLGHESRAATC